MHPGGVKLRVVLGTLAGQDVDAIVRVVTGSRRRQLGSDELGVLAAAGPAAAAALEELVALAHPRGLRPGEAVSTTAGDLTARWLIHVVGPQSTVRRREEHLLAAAYRDVLRVADELGARTLALPPLGMTAPYWPLDSTTRVAISTLPHTQSRVREVILVVRTPAALDVLAEALSRQ
jgi:O-acetyl-ADP-ribose deacetylase (regulator of RNase III)